MSLFAVRTSIYPRADASRSWLRRLFVEASDGQQPSGLAVGAPGRFGQGLSRGGSSPDREAEQDLGHGAGHGDDRRQHAEGDGEGAVESRQDRRNRFRVAVGNRLAG